VSTEGIMLKFHESSTWPMCSILIISQVVDVQMESNQRQMKANIHIYNLHEDT